MVRDFELTAVSKSNAVFDLEKLAWMNSEYVRHLAAERLTMLVEQELRSAGLWRDAWAGEERERFETIARLLQTRARSVQEFTQTGRAFFTDDFAYDPEAEKKFWKDAALPVLLRALAERLSAVEPFDLATTEQALRGLAEEKAVKAGLLINATRVALTGQAVAPGLFEVMLVLGRERVVERLRRAADHLDSREVSPGK
jgi:glutamyl-tRNA synthetase